MDCSYSVDMVTIVGKADNELFHDFVTSTTYYNAKVDYFQNFKHFSYRHLWVYESGDSSIILKYRLNADKPSNQYKWELEFNPNKIDEKQVCTYLKYLMSISRNIYTKRFDVACDIPINILNLSIDKGRKHEVRSFSKGSDDLTYYIGTRNRHGDVKVYNKAKELQSRGKAIDGDLTRFEITLEGEYSMNFLSESLTGSIPEYSPPQLILYKDLMFTDKVDVQDILIVEGLRNRPELFNSLSRRLRERLKQSQAVERFEIDKIQVNITVYEYLLKLKNDLSNTKLIEIRRKPKQVMSTGTCTWEELIKS